MPWNFTPSSDLPGNGNCQYVTTSTKLSRHAVLEFSKKGELSLHAPVCPDAAVHVSKVSS